MKRINWSAVGNKLLSSAILALLILGVIVIIGLIDNDKPIVVQLIGDSVTHKSRSALQNELGDDYKVLQSYVNMKDVGRFSERMPELIKNATIRDALWNADYVVYNAGLHDAKDPDFAENYRGGLRFSLSFLKQHTSGIVLFRETTNVVDGNPHRTNEQIAICNQIALEVCKELDVALVSHGALIGESHYKDMIHLNKRGNEILAEELARSLQRPPRSDSE